MAPAVIPAPPSFAPGPPYFELLGPNTWRETPWSASRCIHGDAELAAGDRLHCPAHAAGLANERTAEMTTIPEARGQASSEDACPDEDGACTDSTHEHFDIDAVYDGWQADAEDRHWAGEVARGGA